VDNGKAVLGSGGGGDVASVKLKEKEAMDALRGGKKEADATTNTLKELWQNLTSVSWWGGGWCRGRGAPERRGERERSWREEQDYVRHLAHNWLFFSHVLLT
jgi:hypothetical protein